MGEEKKESTSMKINITDAQTYVVNENGNEIEPAAESAQSEEKK